jgi:hypothetical protein
MNHYFNKILKVNKSYGFFLKKYFSLQVLNIENEIHIYLQNTLIKHILFLLLRVLLFTVLAIALSPHLNSLKPWLNEVLGRKIEIEKGRKSERGHETLYL